MEDLMVICERRTEKVGRGSRFVDTPVVAVLATISAAICKRFNEDKLNAAVNYVQVKLPVITTEAEYVNPLKAQAEADAKAALQKKIASFSPDTLALLGVTPAKLAELGLVAPAPKPATTPATTPAPAPTAPATPPQEPAAQEPVLTPA